MAQLIALLNLTQPQEIEPKYTKFTEYNPESKDIWAKRDAIICIREYNLETGKQIKHTQYFPDGETIWYIKEYNPQTGALIKETKYNEYDINEANKIAKDVFAYNPQTNQKTKLTTYKKDGTIDDITEYEYDPRTGKRIKWSFRSYNFALFRFLIQLFIYKLLFKTLKLSR
ncbi:Hypothetical Protein SLY_0897 [Strawberry lethal yellows phytoplasma (CPA) str. NZSb11]|uniref:DUF2963 domain-containing protein n=1 Tax=Strawberry lethal yellows phytoplasma (CPA) str. NZSb11 TaxID=980422 RepID=R4RY16_PHYAS|nr:Hypothetical Protein SLY_0897 [Strawberry lethal yellows phytoplasma (CPA) str. NZSb11]